MKTYKCGIQKLDQLEIWKFTLDISVRTFNARNCGPSVYFNKHKLGKLIKTLQRIHKELE